MAKDILFILTDQYGNSLENYRLSGRISIFYVYPNTKPKEVYAAEVNSGIINGNLPLPDKGIESTLVVIEFDSEFYNAPGKLLYKGLVNTPQKIALSKKAITPEKKADILKRTVEDLKQSALERVGFVRG